MGNDERNFRYYYYEKVGFRSIEEKKSVDILLKEKPWDIEKLKQFSLRFSIPASYRNLLWKVQLGVLPTYTDIHPFVTTQRQLQFNDLQNALKVMRIVDNNTPKSQVFLAMYMLEQGRLLYDFNLQMDCGMVAIADTILQMYHDDVDVYWLAKGIYKFVESSKNDVPRLIDMTKTFLEKEDQDLYRFLKSKYVLDCLPLEKWFDCCFAGILNEPALVKIWDKICAGSMKILVYVAISLLITQKKSILRCKDAEQIMKCIQEIPEELEKAIEIKTMELWQQYGSTQSEPNKAIKSDIHLR